MSIFSKSISKSKGVSYISEKYGVAPNEVKSLDSSKDCLFSVYDHILQEFNPPFVSKNLLVAIRSMRDSLKGQKTIVSMHPEDYSLVCVGYFDKASGSVTPCKIIDSSFYSISRILLDTSDENKENEV